MFTRYGASSWSGDTFSKSVMPRCRYCSSFFFCSAARAAASSPPSFTADCRAVWLSSSCACSLATSSGLADDAAARSSATIFLYFSSSAIRRRSAADAAVVAFFGFRRTHDAFRAKPSVLNVYLRYAASGRTAQRR